MEGIPIIRLEIEGMKHSLMTAIIDHNKEMEEIVKAKLEKICTVEYMEALIEKELRDLIPQVIHDSFFDYSVMEGFRSTVIKEIMPKTLEADSRMAEAQANQDALQAEAEAQSERDAEIDAQHEQGGEEYYEEPPPDEDK